MPSSFVNTEIYFLQLDGGALYKIFIKTVRVEMNLSYLLNFLTEITTHISLVLHTDTVREVKSEERAALTP